MSDALLNLDGLNEECARTVTDAFNVLNRYGDAKVLSDSTELQQVQALLASASVNLFNGTAELLNVIRVRENYFVQVMLQRDNHRHKQAGKDYDLLQVGYKAYENDYGDIRITAAENGVTQSIARFLKNFFSSDSLDIEDQDTFNDRYQVTATDKTSALTILTDKLLKRISCYEGLQLSISNNIFLVCAVGVDRESAAAVMEVLDAAKL